MSANNFRAHFSCLLSVSFPEMGKEIKEHALVTHLTCCYSAAIKALEVLLHYTLSTSLCQLFHSFEWSMTHVFSLNCCELVATCKNFYAAIFDTVFISSSQTF